MGARTEMQRVVLGCHSTSRGAAAGGTLENLWLPQACASPQGGGPPAFLGETWHEVAEAFQAWAQGPGCRNTCQVEDITG